MPKINIDELIEPIEVTVGGQDYTIEDISRELQRKISKVSKKAQEAKKAFDAAEKLALADPKIKLPDLDDSNDVEMAKVMAEVLGAEAKDILALGMRKLNNLVLEIMRTITEEMEAKNVPKVAATK